MFISKKFSFLYIILLLTVSFVVSSSADSYSQGKKLYDSLFILANNIVSSNKPAFEAKGKEAYVFWSRVWAKDKTIVSAISWRNKTEFLAHYIVTRDLNFVFAGGLHVGSKIIDLEKYLGVSFEKNRTRGNISLSEYVDPEEDIQVLYENGKIFQIEAIALESEQVMAKSKNFIRKKMKEMNIFSKLY